MSENKGYHAHVYYNAETKAKAAALREALLGKFKVEAGGFSDAPRGPHPISQFNIIFETPEFDSVVPWLMLNRDGLDVLVHPLTDSSYNDHTALRDVARRPGVAEDRDPASRAGGRPPDAERAAPVTHDCGIEIYHEGHKGFHNGHEG